MNRFQIGQQVRVAKRFPSGHVRTPHYIRGKTGVIADAVGHFPDPEMAAVGKVPTLRELFRVRFLQSEAWRDYSGAPQDSIDVEIYEHWLEPVTKEVTS
jgi:nitrile hydratase subunit beta